MFYIGTGSITVESCSITEEALKAVNPGFVKSGDSSHKTSVDFIIDIQYTEHDIGCYADPIELTGTFERIHFTFPDQEIKDNSKLKEILDKIKTKNDSMRMYEYILAISLFSLHPSFGFEK